jgi:hypothetical protein
MDLNQGLLRGASASKSGAVFTTFSITCIERNKAVARRITLKLNQPKINGRLPGWTGKCTCSPS